MGIKPFLINHLLSAGQSHPQFKTSCLISMFIFRHEDDAIPCEAAPMFFDLNERIGQADAPFLTPADIDRAKAARPDYRK